MDSTIQKSDWIYLAATATLMVAGLYVQNRIINRWIDAQKKPNE